MELEPGARLSQHQDRNERDFDAPIVSVSLGAPATFLWGGRTRTERPRKFLLEHGGVVVWGAPARLHDLVIVDELAEPDLLLHYSLHEPRRGIKDIKKIQGGTAVLYLEAPHLMSSGFGVALY